MAIPRFYMPEMRELQSLDLTSDEARHARDVLRLRIGDAVCLFDGRGWEAEGRVSVSTKTQVTISLEPARPVSRELLGDLNLAVSLPKGDRQRQLVEMLVQLGVHSLTPLICRRSVAQPTDHALNRLRRAVIEASKQCGRTWLMKIEQPVAIEAWPERLQDLSPETSQEAVYYAHPDHQAPGIQNVIGALSAAQVPRLNVAIGPEGGFDPREIERMGLLGCRPVALGRRILRVETAAIAIAAVWAAYQDASSP